MNDKELEFTTRLTREDVAGVIEALVEGLKDGHLKIHKSSETLELEVPRVIDLEIEAKVSDERAKFEIEVSWRTNRAENPDAPDENTPIQKMDAGKKKAVFSDSVTAGKGAQDVRGGKAAKGIKGPAKRPSGRLAGAGAGVAAEKPKKPSGRAVGSKSAKNKKAASAAERGVVPHNT